MFGKFWRWLRKFFGALFGFLQVALIHLKKEGLEEFKDFAVDTIRKIAEDPIASPMKTSGRNSERNY